MQHWFELCKGTPPIKRSLSCFLRSYGLIGWRSFRCVLWRLWWCMWFDRLFEVLMVDWLIDGDDELLLIEFFDTCFLRFWLVDWSMAMVCLQFAASYLVPISWCCFILPSVAVLVLPKQLWGVGLDFCLTAEKGWSQSSSPNNRGDVFNCEHAGTFQRTTVCFWDDCVPWTALKYFLDHRAKTYSGRRFSFL